MEGAPEIETQADKESRMNYSHGGGGYRGERGSGNMLDRVLDSVQQILQGTWPLPGEVCTSSPAATDSAFTSIRLYKSPWV